MTASQFFVPRLEAGSSCVVVRGREHRHLARAARVRPGDQVRLFDLEGNRCLAGVVSVGLDRTELRVLKHEEPEGWRVKLTLVQALLPARKMELILQKAAEIGCSEFLPVTTERSLKGLEERSGRKLERWTRIALEATKQSKGGRATAVHPPQPLKSVLRGPSASRKLFLSEHGGRPLRDLLSGGAGLRP
jgi:16S rRNA (uracil1498-N3)-methyltransferase